VHILIPARYAATRLPGKPLRDVAGAPLIVRVYERAIASGAQRVTVATDDERIADVIRRAGGEAILTASTHASGTDRIAEAVTTMGLSEDDVIVNLQGDEPLMTPSLLAETAAALESHPTWAMSTAAHAIAGEEAFQSPHVVKVVCDCEGRALYFSRAPIPWPRGDGLAVCRLRHIGLYAYRVRFLRLFTSWPAGVLERTEGLEQLRALEHGAAIGVVVTHQEPGIGVDTEEDLRRANLLWTPV
jgi:3-deoxy-manno-octulosonate cytidylyltransferase (CMP-KDO synthetase)